MAKAPFIALAATLSAVAIFAGFAFGQDADDVNVSCYAGTEEQYYEVGNLDVSDPIRRAVGLCNAMYRDCYGRCWACWTDSEGSAVCKDLTGRQFYR